MARHPRRPTHERSHKPRAQRRLPTAPIFDSQPRWPYVATTDHAFSARELEACAHEWDGAVSGIYARPDGRGIDCVLSLAEAKTRGRHRLTIAGLLFHRQ